MIRCGYCNEGAPEYDEIDHLMDCPSAPEEQRERWFFYLRRKAERAVDAAWEKNR